MVVVADGAESGATVGLDELGVAPVVDVDVTVVDADALVEDVSPDDLVEA